MTTRTLRSLPNYVFDDRDKPLIMPTRCAFAVFALSAALAGRAESQPSAPPAPRTELPVKLVTLPDGARRYTVPLTIGATAVEAGLDTGSVGLRVLPGTLKPDDAKLTEVPDTMRYGSGAMYDGVVATATLDIAGLKGESSFQQVQKVGCAPRKPDCPVSKITPAEYGMMGDGLSGAGFKAILGVGPKTVNIDNPLRRLGVTRFIVELPREANEAGRLILNPTPADMEGFVTVPAYKRTPAQTQLPDSAVTGCLLAKAQGHKICGAVTFDSGAPGITVVSPDSLGKAWPKGTKASIALDDGAGRPVATDDMVVGDREDAAALHFRQMVFLPKTIIRMGIAPYLTYSVLYDFDRGGLSVKARVPRS